MSKFDNVLAEGAYEITLHGFADEEYGTTDTTGWNALVTVSAVTLLNVGATDLSARFRQEYGDDTLYAWIRENNEGFVTLVEHTNQTKEAAHWTDAVDRKFADYTADMDKAAEEEEISGLIDGNPWQL